MKLEVGTYVRFDNVICQIEEVEEDWLCFDIGFYNHWNELTYSMKYKEFVEEYKPRFSDSIIDLIEVGDIIKFDITDIDNYADIQGYNCWEISCEEELNGVKEMIEMESAKLLSIVTKEQFESMSYRVGSEE